MATELTAILFALAREARAFRRLASCRRQLHAAPCPAWQNPRQDLLVLQTGMGSVAMSRALHWLLQGGQPARVISAGFCGGLSPDLYTGQLVQPDRVVDETGQAWAITQAEDLARSATLLSVSRPVLTTEDRQRLYELTGAVAVDMESATAARLCADAGVPFACMRIVSDDVRTPLPAELGTVMRNENIDGFRLAAAIWRRPGLIADLWQLAGRTRRAAKTLAQGLRQTLRLESEVNAGFCNPVSTGGTPRCQRRLPG